MDEKNNPGVSPKDGNFSKDKKKLEEDPQSKQDLERRWDKKNGDRSEVIDSEGHRNRINHY